MKTCPMTVLFLSRQGFLDISCGRLKQQRCGAHSICSFPQNFSFRADNIVDTAHYITRGFSYQVWLSVDYTEKENFNKTIDVLRIVDPLHHGLTILCLSKGSTLYVEDF